MKSSDSDLEFFFISSQFSGQLLYLFLSQSNKFMQWRIQQSNCDWKIMHCFQYAVEVLSLEREKLHNSSPTCLFIFSNNQFSHSQNSLWIKKHMFCPAQPNPFSTKVTGLSSIIWAVSIGSNSKFANIVSDFHETPERFVFCGICLYHRKVTFVNEPFCAVQSNYIPFVQSLPIHRHFFPTAVNIEGTTSHNATLSPSPGYKGCVAGHATFSRKNGLSGMHAVNIFW